jgi:hypothetical protein
MKKKLKGTKLMTAVRRGMNPHMRVVEMIEKLVSMVLWNCILQIEVGIQHHNNQILHRTL